MHQLSTRARVFGVVTILFAIATAVLCVFFGLAFMGIGTWVAASAEGSLGLGALVGMAGLTGATIGIVLSILKGYVGVLILRGRTIGLVLGLGLAALSVASGFGGAWMALAWGVFGLWALWTSRSQFR